MRAGELRERIEIQAATRTDEPGGGWTDTLATVAEVWAKVEPLQGDEQLQAMQVGLSAPHRFTIRYRSGVSAANVLRWRDRRFDVRSVVDTDARRRELVILADEAR